MVAARGGAVRWWRLEEEQCNGGGSRWSSTVGVARGGAVQWWRLAEEEPHSRGNLRECVQQQTARGVASDEGVQPRTRSLQATKCFLQCIFLQLGAEIEVARGIRGTGGMRWSQARQVYRTGGRWGGRGRSAFDVRFSTQLGGESGRGRSEVSGSSR